MSFRIQDRLTALRTFFVETEPRLPVIIALSYQRLFEVEPGIAQLFKGNIREQQSRFLAQLQSIVKLTRSSQLWPASAATGQILIPDIVEFGRRHAKLGVLPVHFSLMNDMMSWTCKELASAGFTPLVEEGLAFVFDVLGASLTAKASAGDALSMLRSRWSAAPLADPSAYFDEELTAARA
jgi:hemoglobin-like flavoprotein